MKRRTGKISVLLTGLAGGGAERVSLTLAQGFAARGHDVDLVVTRASGPLLNEVPEEVRLVNLEASRISRSLLPLVRYLRAVRPVGMLSAMKSMNCLAIWARVLSRTGSRLVVVEHSTLSESTRHSHDLRQRILPNLMRRSYPFADRVVAVSSGVADDLAQTIGYPRDQIDVIYNPVVTPTLLERSMHELDHPWFAEGAPPVVLAAGRLAQHKDFPTLLRAFARVRAGREAHLMILGEGEERGKLEALAEELGISEWVELPGFVSNPYKYMRRAAVFVLASKYEGLPTVLIEAMACGASIVSTDCPSGPAEILEEGRWGHLVPVGRPRELAEAIADTLEESRIHARDRAMSFCVESAIEPYLTVLSHH